MIFFIEILALGVVTMAVVALHQATRKDPGQLCQTNDGQSNWTIGQRKCCQTIYSALKVNSAGVMPIIFAQAIMFLPGQVLLFFGGEGSEFARTMNDFTSFGYNAVFFVLIVVFTFFYTAITINPNEIADQLKRGMEDSYRE